MINGAVALGWREVESQLQRAKQSVASHPGAGLVAAFLFGVFLGIWIKRK